MQPEARCLLLVLFVCIVNLSNIVGVPPSASAGRRCLSKADAKVRTFSRTRKLFGDFFCKKGDFGAFFDLGQGHGEGIHIIYICAREMDKPRSRAAGNRTEDDGQEAGERGRRNPAAKLRGTVAIMEGEREMDEPRSRAAGNRTEGRGTERRTGNGERDGRRRRMGEIEKSRDVSQHTALSLSRPIRSWTSRIAAFSQMYFRLRDDTHRLDVCKTTKTIKNIKDSISLSV